MFYCVVDNYLTEVVSYFKMLLPNSLYFDHGKSFNNKMTVQLNMDNKSNKPKKQEESYVSSFNSEETQ